MAADQSARGPKSIVPPIDKNTVCTMSRRAGQSYNRTVATPNGPMHCSKSAQRILKGVCHTLEPAIVGLNLPLLGETGEPARKKNEVVEIAAGCLLAIAIDLAQGCGLGADFRAAGPTIVKLSSVGIHFQDVHG